MNSAEVNTTVQPFLGEVPPTPARVTAMQPTDHLPGPREGPADWPELVARTTETEDGSIQCTLYPAEASDEERLTHWITAGEDWYIDVASHR
ncbi:MAG: hypothetical protein ACI8U4_000910 [Natronomonas sp.]|jgi:hypothetical protein